jgi:hypothetical protein
MTNPIPSAPELEIVLLDEPVVSLAEHCISGCENCAANAMTALDYLLDVLTGCDPTVTEYVMCRAARCSFCGGHITEKTLIAVQIMERTA